MPSSFPDGRRKTSLPPARAWLRVLIAFFVAFDLAAFFQWADGALQSEFGGHPDEAAHYLTGVRVRDALRHGGDRSGESAALHPFAALRRTAPFDVVQGSWMLAFGTSRLAVLLFMAALAAATAALIFCTVRHAFGAWAGVVAALLWLCAPTVRESYETILPEQFHAMLLTAAVLLWAGRVDRNAARRRALMRGIAAASRVGGGCLLALIFAIVLPIFAMPLLKECALSLGLGAAAFALAGALLRRPAEAAPSAVWRALLALVAGVIVAHWMHARGSEGRWFILATPALAMLAARGAISLAGTLGARRAIAGEKVGRGALWLFLLLLLTLPPDLLHSQQKDWSGFGAAARTLLEEAHGGMAGPVRVLVVSDARGEGVLLAEIAMQDRAGKIAIERGSEMVAAGMADREGSLDDEQLFARLTSGRIHFIALDSAPRDLTRADAHDQMRRVIEDHVRNFWPIAESPITRDGEPQGHPLRIFRVLPAGGAELPL